MALIMEEFGNKIQLQNATELKLLILQERDFALISFTNISKLKKSKSTRKGLLENDMK